MAEVGGMLASAILKVVGEQIGSALGGQITLQKDFTEDLEKMKMALVSVEAVLEDAERLSVTTKSVRLWLKRLKDVMYDISDMIDEFEETRKFPHKNYLALLGPCLTFDHKITMANKMKNMRDKLNVIKDQRNDFGLIPGTTSNGVNVIDKRKTTESISEEDKARIVGRTKETQKILDSLSESMAVKAITILPIYGIGGLGKTTLAKMVYGSSKFKDYSQVWVYVSQIFDLMKIGNSIISQLSNNEASLLEEIQLIERSLSGLLADKKIMIVLDDLWEDNKEFHLDKLKTMLGLGKGSNVVVIVTTRDEAIANELCTNIQPHRLEPLTDEMCWTIIKQKTAFESRNNKKELQPIGLDIANKCGGVALAARSLGHILHSLSSADQWESVRNSDIWSVSPSNSTFSTPVLPSLRLSYSFMPPWLKLCFAYCAIFPKGYKIDKNDLIYQWISLGFIEPPKVLSHWQLGEIYIKQLLGMSFLQDSNFLLSTKVYLEDATSFTMHDLVHDLARSVMQDEILVTGKPSGTGQSCFHYALLDDFSKPLGLSKIRALRFMDSGSKELHDAAFSSAKSMRVLDLSECAIHKLPDSIGRLKQLRYLDAPRVQDQTIPNSITRLSKLIYLNLSGSSAIKALPEAIGEIEGLMYLDLSGCSEIRKLPESLGGLKKLVHLDFSTCSRVNGISLLLGGLTELQYLNLSYCKNIGDQLPGALGGLSKLQYLNLSFSSYLECCKEAEVLGALTNLEYLNLSSEYCHRERLPEALGSFAGLRYLNLSGWHYLKVLPCSFGDLKNLVHLDMSNCYRVNGLSGALGRLTNLQYLNLSMTHCHTGMEEVIGNLTKLRYLNLSGIMESIPEIEIGSSVCRISTLSNLEHLDLSHNRSICSIPESISNLTKLHTLDVSGTGLRQMPESICTMDSLKFLHFNNCSYLSKLPQLGSSAISLPHFVVRASGGELRSNLPLLQPTNPDKLEISGLEHVKSVEEAVIINLMEKKKLVHLKFEWTADAERSVDDKLLLKKLVPPNTLNCLEIQGYNGVSFPAWLIGQLPNLNLLVLSGMKYLEEWDMSCSSANEEHVITSLRISDCPKLRMKSLPPRVESLKISNSDNVLLSRGECTISHDGVSSSSSLVTTELFVQRSNVPLHQWGLLHRLPGFTYLEIRECSDLTASPEITRRLSSIELLVLEDNDLEELPQWLGELSCLQELSIGYEGVKELHKNMRKLTKLQKLTLNSCGSMASLPHWLGELTSLKELQIRYCTGINSLPESIQQLTNFQQLWIAFCPALKQWCQSDENERKLAHIEYKIFE